MKLSPYSAIADRHHHEITLTPLRVQVDVRCCVLLQKKKED